MSITLFTTKSLGGNKHLFRDDCIEIVSISKDTELFRYLYDEGRSQLRTRNGGQELQLYRLKGQPIYAIKCIDNDKYNDFEKPNEEGKSEYISILVEMLLGLSKKQNESINIILHQGDINLEKFLSTNEYELDTANSCYWLFSDSIKKCLLNKNIVTELDDKRCTIRIALFSHVGTCPFSKILKEDHITPTEIDDEFAKHETNDTDLKNNDTIQEKQTFLFPKEFTVTNPVEYCIQQLEEKDKRAENVTIEWSEKNIQFQARIVTYGTSYFELKNNLKPEGNTMYCQEQYKYTSPEESTFIPTIHIFDGKVTKHPRFYDITDSSIWNYRCSYGDQERLLEILKAIAVNTKNDLYKLAVSYEYVDLNARLLENSYVVACGNSGHEIVSPFLFHSEVEMKQKLENWDSLQHNWRFLLVDDHAVEGMGYKKDILPSASFGKARIIADCFKNAGLSIDIKCYEMDREDSLKEPFDCASCQTHGSNCIRIDCVTNIGRAIELATHSRYDIILLDYRLKDGIEFGYELLEKIHDNHKELTYNGKIGPNGRFYFMFISAYTTAVSQRFLKAGYRISTKYWFIDKGACPTNTPYLFLYSLKRLMDKRYETLTKHGKNLTTALKIDSSEKPVITVIDFLDTLYSPEDEKPVRERCKNGFNAFLLLRSTYDRIKYDVWDGKIHKKEDQELDEKFVLSEENESKLVHSIFPDVICYNNTFWEHLQHLVYLTAYGTNRQWPEMWEELQSVSGILNNAESIIQADPKVVKQIRNYILDLKHQNSR